MKQIKNIYFHRGFYITKFNAKTGFETLQDGLTSLQIELNTFAEDEYIQRDREVHPYHQGENPRHMEHATFEGDPN